MREVLVLIVLGCGRVGFDAVPVTRIAAGTSHTCALRNGSVYCWGANDEGQLGQGTMSPYEAPLRVPGIRNAIDVAAGDKHTCVLHSTGAISCWGRSFEGQLGDNSPGLTPLSTIPVRTELGGATTLSLGGNLSCALTATNLYCWGALPTSGAGECAGPGSAGFSHFRVPTDMGNLAAPTHVDASSGHACVVHGGTISCFGNNACNQLGDGSLLFQNALVTTLGVDAVTSISVGGFHSCATRSDETVLCWGGNNWGQLGAEAPSIGTFVAAPTPLLGGGIDVGAGYQHTCVLAATGRVRCAGLNSNGAIGNGTLTTGYEVSEVVELSDAVSLSVGVNSVFAIRATGEVVGWGDNSMGQLDASLLDSGTPIPILLPDS